MVQKQNGLAKVQNERTGQDGFTLAELLIVMVIMGILAAMAIPRFADQIEIARENVDISNLRNAYTAVRSMMAVRQFEDNEKYYYDPDSGSLISSTSKAEMANFIKTYSNGYMKGTRFGLLPFVNVSDLPSSLIYDIENFSSHNWLLPVKTESGYVIQAAFSLDDATNEIISKIGFVKLPDIENSIAGSETPSNA